MALWFWPDRYDRRGSSQEMRLLSIVLALALTGCATDSGFIGHPQTVICVVCINPLGEPDREPSDEDLEQ